MHSDYLNEDKICQMFQQDIDSARRKEQVSLNLTVTSRQSRCAGLIERQKMYNQIDQTQHKKESKNYDISGNSTTDSIGLALSQLDKFNIWAEGINKSDEMIIEELENIMSSSQQIKCIDLSKLDHNYIKKIYGKPVKIYNEGNQVKDCRKCKENQELIQVIHLEYKTKVQQCCASQERIEKLERELHIESINNIRNYLLDGVDNNLLKEQNESINSQLVMLKVDFDKSKLQKSTSSMQKSTSFLKTKDLMEKRLQSNIQNGTNTNSKLFSNGKFSTNLLNPNDTYNRVDSIISFELMEPNIQELIKYFSDQVGSFKSRLKEFKQEEQKQRQRQKQKQKEKKIKTKREQRVCFSNLAQNQNKIVNVYSILQSKLIQLKVYRQKYPYLFNLTNSVLKESKQYRQTTRQNRDLKDIKQNRDLKQFKQKRETNDNLNIIFKLLQENEDLKKRIQALEKEVKGLENEKNNLQQTNSDIISSYNQLNRKIKDLEEKLQKMKFQYRTMYESERNETHKRKKLQFQLQQMKGFLRFYCRVRPRIGNQLKHKSSIVYAEDSRIIKEGKEYQFDYVFNDKSTQSQIYEQIRPLVEHAYEKKNLCIFAYGQTGSGKTYTVHGQNGTPGIGTNIINELYELVNKDKKNIDVTISMSMVELYKQQIRDLLVFGNKLEIKQRVDEGVYVEGCKIIRFHNREQMMDVYSNAINSRAANQIELNSSSRTHFIVTFYIQKWSKKNKEDCTISKITLVDLAGSQKLTSSNPLISKENQSISKCFLTLMSILSGLKSKQQSLPYRQSKLTYMLKQQLTPKCNIITFITISGSQINSSETTNSLIFGVRSKGGQKNPSKQRELKQLREMKQLKENKQNEKNRRSLARLSIG